MAVVVDVAPAENTAGPLGASDPGSDEAPRETVSVYYSGHDLRATYTRENTERRRQSSHTLRRFLTTKQDKECLNKFVRLREQFEVANNDDVVLLYARMKIDEGKADELDPRLLELAKATEIKERNGPFDPK